MTNRQRRVRRLWRVWRFDLIVLGIGAAVIYAVTLALRGIQ